MSRHFLLFLLTLTASLLACSPENKTPSQTCVQDSDCGAGQSCEDGICRADTFGNDGGIKIQTKPTSSDRDGDGIENDEELRIGTNPDSADSDGDGLLDGEEINFGSDPKVADSDSDGLNDATEFALGTSPLSGDSDGDGRSDKEEWEFGTNPAMSDDYCDELSGEASEVKAPVDIIIIVDNSGSMAGEAAAVRRNLNASLAMVLDRSGIDYRVIMIARYGTNRTRICVDAPLSGGCGGACPNHGPRYFHYNRQVESRDSLSILISDYAKSDSCGSTGWGSWLRPGSHKVFLEITDDNSRLNHDNFVQLLSNLNRDHFGTPDAPKFTFHAITGLQAASTPTGAHPPADPVVSGRCTPGSENSGDQYQHLARRTNGLRFPICDNSSFDTIFEALAVDVIQSVALPCTFATENAAADQTLAKVTYLPGAGGEMELRAIENAAACAMGDFYPTPEGIRLCTPMCNIVSNDSSGKLQLKFGCLNRCGNGVVDDGEECDDGNATRFDNCSPLCQIECGNGIIEGTESCDDGNRLDDDGCSAECQVLLE